MGWVKWTKLFQIRRRLPSLESNSLWCSFKERPKLTSKSGRKTFCTDWQPCSWAKLIPNSGSRTWELRNTLTLIKLTGCGDINYLTNVWLISKHTLIHWHGHAPLTCSHTLNYQSHDIHLHCMSMQVLIHTLAYMRHCSMIETQIIHSSSITPNLVYVRCLNN